MLVFSKEKMIEVIGKNAYEAGKALADEMGIEMPYNKMDMMPIVGEFWHDELLGENEKSYIVEAEDGELLKVSSKWCIDAEPKACGSTKRTAIELEDENSEISEAFKLLHALEYLNKIEEKIENNEEISEEEIFTSFALMVDVMGYDEEEEREEENKHEISDNFDESLSEMVDGLRLLQRYGYIM